MIKTKLGYETGGGCEISQLWEFFFFEKKTFLKTKNGIVDYCEFKKTTKQNKKNCNSAGCELSHPAKFRSYKIFGFCLLLQKLIKNLQK